MAATVIIQEWTSTGTRTDKTSGTVRFKNANNATVDLLNPIVKPTTGGGEDISFEKVLRLNVTSSSTTFTQIDNIKAYSDGANGMGAGITVLAKSASTWTAPIEPATTTGYANFFSHVSTAALALSTGTFADTGVIGDWWRGILRATTAASGGITPGETLTFSYDEI